MSVDDMTPELRLTVSQYNPLWQAILKAMGALSEDGKTIIMVNDVMRQHVDMTVTVGDATVTYRLDSQPSASMGDNIMLTETVWNALILVEYNGHKDLPVSERNIRERH